jgi:CBS domain-containing protein
VPHKLSVAHASTAETTAPESAADRAAAAAPKVDGIALRASPSCGPDDLLSRPARLLCENALDCLPVVTQSGRVVGLISLRDIDTAACLLGRPFHSLRVQHAMTRHAFSCTKEDSISTAMQRMLRHEIRHLPVTDADGGLLGLIAISALKREPALDSAREPRESGERVIALPRESGVAAKSQ